MTEQATFRGGKAESARVTPDKGVDEEILCGFYFPAGGTTGEWSITWGRFRCGGKWVKLEVFDDAFPALAQCPDLIAELGKIGNDPTPAQVMVALERCGFRDATEWGRNES